LLDEQPEEWDEWVALTTTPVVNGVEVIDNPGGYRPNWRWTHTGDGYWRLEELTKNDEDDKDDENDDDDADGCDNNCY
jgi:hypothetical protein